MKYKAVLGIIEKSNRVGKMINFLKRIYQSVINWMYPEIRVVLEKFDDSHKILTKMHHDLEEKRTLIEKELLFHKSLIEAIFEGSPDMMWLKDVNGVYMEANSAVKEGLLFDCNPIGKNDVEIAMNAKEKYGDKNHTFGEVCANSDLVILETLTSQRFFEYGKVKGEMLYLEVYKFPFYVRDELVGVAGVGRDLTPYVHAYKELNCSKCSLGLTGGSPFDIFKFESKDV